MEFQSFRMPFLKTETLEAVATDFQILVFCTSLRNLGDVRKITPVLNAIPEINSWSVDLEDCDKVLRIICESVPIVHILKAVHKTGFNIWEMVD